MRNFFMPLLLTAAILMTGCAGLTGIPLGLTTCQEENAAKTCIKYMKDELAAAKDLSETLTVANSLSNLYIQARDVNYSYAFWSNALYFPLGIAAASYTAHKKHPNALINVGIATGALAGVNTFVNARGNGKFYLSGINALMCLDTQLRPFTLDATNMRRDELETIVAELAQAIANTNAFLSTMDPLLNNNLTSPAAQKEQNRSPAIVGILIATKQTLTSANAEAQKAVDGANAELGKFAHLTTYAKNKIVIIDRFIETKINQPDVNYQTLLKSLTPAGAAPAPTQKGATPSGVGQTEMQDPFPIQSLVIRAQSIVVDILGKTKEVSRKTSELGLSAAQKAVDECVTSM